MPFVPVVSFWSTRESISLAELRTGLANGQVLVADDDLAPLGVAPSASRLSMSVDDVRSAVREEGRLGVLRATDVDQSVRALALDGVSLFGNARISDIGEWPLRATVETSEPWQQESTWTLVATGDMMLDRIVITNVNEAGGDKEYLFNGGTARVARVRCCSFFNYPYPVIERTGNAGLVRELLTHADLTIGNLESAVLHDAPHHADPRGFSFTADAEWMPVLAANGFDLLSVANNHSNDAGTRGLATAIETIRAAGMAAAGAGLGDDVFSAELLEAHGARVAVIACSGIRGRNAVQASPDRALAMSCNDGSVAREIGNVREQADVVIVYPHWGVEYTARPRLYQRELAAEWIAAGADLVIGHHSHFPGAMEDVDGKLVMYSLGNFIFDQDFRQATMMGLVPEMTFAGSELVQVDLHTTLIINSQPNLADPAGDGQFAYDLVRTGSEGLLPY